MGVHDAVGVFAVFVDGAVDDEAGRVEGVVAGLDEVAVKVDFDQAGGGHFVVAEAVGVDQEVVVGSGDAQRDVAVDEFAPAEGVEDSVGGGELLAQFPFVGVAGLCGCLSGG